MQGMSGNNDNNIICRLQNPDIPRAARVGAHGRVARRGRAGLFANRTVRLGNNPSSHSPKASKTRRLNVSPEARTSESLCKPMEEQSPRLTTGSSAVYQRFITGARSALSSWLPTSGTTPFCLCKPFSCKACSGIMMILMVSLIMMVMITMPRVSVPDLKSLLGGPQREPVNLDFKLHKICTSTIFFKNCPYYIGLRK